MTQNLADFVAKHYKRYLKKEAHIIRVLELQATWNLQQAGIIRKKEGIK